MAEQRSFDSNDIQALRKIIDIDANKKRACNGLNKQNGLLSIGIFMSHKSFLLPEYPPYANILFINIYLIACNSQ